MPKSTGFLLFLVSLSAAASQSKLDEEIRLDRNGGSMALLPIMDQRPLGLCFAYAGSEMLNAYRFSHGDQKTDYFLSPIAMGVPSSNDLDNIGGGAVDSAIEEGISGSACSTAQMEKLVNASKDGSAYLSFFMHLKRNLYKSKQFWADHPNPAELSENPGWLATKQAFLPLITPDNAAPFEKVAAEIFQERNLAISFNGEANDNSVGYASKLLTTACSPTALDLSWIPKPKSIFAGDFPQKDRYLLLRNRISQLIHNENPQPVEISMCVNALDQNSTFPKSCVHHAMVVIGERSLSTKEKVFLVRNSWGTEWCPSQSNRDQCEGGQAWIHEKQLIPAVRVLYTLDQN